MSMNFLPIPVLLFPSMRPLSGFYEVLYKRSAIYLLLASPFVFEETLIALSTTLLHNAEDLHRTNRVVFLWTTKTQLHLVHLYARLSRTQWHIWADFNWANWLNCLGAGTRAWQVNISLTKACRIGSNMEHQVVSQNFLMLICDITNQTGADNAVNLKAMESAFDWRN